jgi:hypothetical protein
VNQSFSSDKVSTMMNLKHVQNLGKDTETDMTVKTILIYVNRYPVLILVNIFPNLLCALLSIF